MNMRGEGDGMLMGGMQQEYTYDDPQSGQGALLNEFRAQLIGGLSRGDGFGAAAMFPEGNAQQFHVGDVMQGVMVGGVGMQQGGIGMMGHGDAPTKYEAVGGSMGSSGSVQQPIMWQGQQQEHQQARQQQQAQQPAVQQQQQHGVGMNQLNDILGALPAEVRAGLQQLQQQMPQGVQVQQVSSLQQAANNHQAIMEQMLGSRRDPIKRRQQNRLAAKRHRERVRARENQLEKEVSNLRLELQDANKQLMEARQETELAAIEANLRAKEAVQAATKAFLMLDKEKEKQKETAMDTDEKKSSLRSWGTVG